MSDKTGKTALKPTTQTQPEKVESDKAFLERNNVQNILSNLMSSLYHNQPKDPINFIYNYFENLSHQDDPLKVAHDRLKIISHHSIMFDDSLLEIYQLFLNSVTTNGNKKEVKPSLADLFNKLIDMLTSDLETELRNNLSSKIKRKEHDAFSFIYFKSAIKIIFLFNDYLEECKLLYKQLEDCSVSSGVNKVLAEILIEQLKQSLNILFSKFLNTKIIMQSMYDLSPAGMTSLINEKISKISLCKDVIALNEFIMLVSKNFTDCINLK